MGGQIKVHGPKDPLKAKILLPGSKSISNRLLIISKLAHSNKNINNLSKADDTVILQNSLKQGEGDHFIKNAGTPARFLTSLFSVTEGDYQLDGIPRMQERPMKPLIDALISLGADIRCTGKEGFLPLKIRGRKLKGGKIKLDASRSSQFISSLLLVAPYFSQGLEIILNGEIISKPYIEMTIKLMRQAGADVSWKNNKISVSRGGYLPVEWNVEPDWSSAAFWYEAVAMREGSEIFFPGLSSASVQGDAFCSELFYSLGVDSVETEEGISISKESGLVTNIIQPRDFVNTPDLAIPYACALTGARLMGNLFGLDSLKLKESDRLEALETELKKTGAVITKGQGSLSIVSKETDNPSPAFQTYQDHRMIMGLAMLSLRFPHITLSDSEEVEKSYPDFWNQMTAAGFRIGES